MSEGEGGTGGARDGGTRGPSAVRFRGGTPPQGWGTPLSTAPGGCTPPCGVSAELKFQNTPPAKSRPDQGPAPRASNPQKFIRSHKKAFWGRNLRMAQSRRHERPRSSRLQHSASFRARNPNKASMTLMLAAASICATDVLERHLAPPGLQCTVISYLAGWFAG